MATEHGGRTFDWAPRFDPRSLNFRAAAGVTQMPTAGRIWHHGPVLDQGAEGACVGFGSAGAVAAEPSSRRGVNNSYARNWYRRAQRLDEWQGEAYEGTSVLAGCLVGRERKLWAGFRWAKMPAELAAGICDDTLGPAVLGVQWSPQLYDVPATGLLPADVELDASMGHCVLLFGYVPPRALVTRDMQDDLEELGLWEAVDAQTEASFLLVNSWSETWGASGTAVAPLALVRRWFAARGEFALPESRTRGGQMVASTEDVEDSEELDDQPGDRTLHITAVEVQDGDRILDPPDGLLQESVTVRGTPRQVTTWGGRRVVIDSTAGTFQLGASDPVTVRRSS
jgi:hypothetical protein